MLLHHKKKASEALQAKKILDFWRVYILLRHYKYYKPYKAVKL